MKKTLEIHTERKKKSFLSGATGNQPEGTEMEKISDTNFHRFYWKISSHVLLFVSQTMNKNILLSSFIQIIIQLNSYSQNVSHLSTCI